MAEFDRPTIAAQRAGTAAAIDEGLRSYMLRVYNYMGIGLVVTGVVAYFSAQAAVANGQLTAWGSLIFQSPLMWVLVLAPLGMVFFMSFRINSLSAPTALTLFFVYAGLLGLSLASIFLVYTGESITRVFFISAASFGALSLWGYTTQRSLDAMGSFLIMGVFGLFIVRRLRQEA